MSSAHLNIPVEIADTGASSYFLTYDAPCKKGSRSTPPIKVGLPDGNTLQSNQTCTLDLPSLPIEARQAHILPILENKSLISIGQVCDYGCTAEYTSSTVSISLNKLLILTCYHDPITKLLCLPLQKTVSQFNPSSPNSQVLNAHQCQSQH